jgi:molybdopterin synthase catalytic subunit
MKVQVRLFARYREAAGRDSLDLELPDGGTVERAWEAVARQLPALQPYRPFTLFALRNDYVGADHPLGDGDELCLFPPVSGGSHPVSSPADWIEITAEPLSERAVAQAVEHPGAGGIALFSGVVRDQTGGRRVKFRWPATARVALVHRIGRLEIGESSVMIAVSSPHRGPAFDACRFAIDTLKETVPIWKKEHFEDGEVWVGLQSQCDHRH